MINKLIISNLIILKNGSRLRKTYSDCYFNKFFLLLLKFLYKKNFILGYLFIDKFKVRIFYKYYKNKGIFDNLYIPNDLNKFLTYNKLNYLSNKSLYLLNSFIIILTSKGFFLLS